MKSFKHRLTPFKFLRFISQLLETSLLGKLNVSHLNSTRFFSPETREHYTSGVFSAQKEKNRERCGPSNPEPMHDYVKVGPASTVASVPNNGDNRYLALRKSLAIGK